MSFLYYNQNISLCLCALGGEIEMDILAKSLKVEIVALNIQTNRLQAYPARDVECNQKIFLLYDNIHYDAAVVRLGSNKVQKKFPIEDISFEERLKEFGRILREKKEFFDSENMSFRCIDCFQTFANQNEILEHVRRTSHQNFSQSL